jgi:two-component system chemotaxis response regulator CheY
MKVMVVDDTILMRHTLKKVISELGHEIVCEAENGFDAIEKYKQYKPDFITLDITMPAFRGVENGINALEQIIEFDPEANIIIVSSLREDKYMVDAICKGAKGYILKPFTKNKLVASLEKIF